MGSSVRRQTLLALGVLVGLTLIFFRQVIFEGMIYAAPDIQASAGATAPLLAAMEEGVYPLWNPYILGGMPSYASLMATPYATPPSLINRLLNAFLVTPRRFDLLLHFLLAGTGVFVYLRRRRASVGASLFGALAFEFSVHLIGMVAFGHTNKMMTIAYLPWALWAVERLMAHPGIGRGATLALVLGLQLLTAHVQMAYYTWLAVGLYVLYWVAYNLHPHRRLVHLLGVEGRHCAESEPQRREGNKVLGVLCAFAVKKLAQRLTLFIAALLLALALSAVLNLPVANYSRYSVRGGSGGLEAEQAGLWSLPPWELLTFVVPRLFGFGGVTYWGGLTFADFPHYAGIVVRARATFAVWVSVLPALRGWGPTVGGRWGRVETGNWTKTTRFRCPLRPLGPTPTPTLPLAGGGGEQLPRPLGDEEGERAPAVPFLALLTLVSALLACGSYLAPLFDALRLLLPLYNMFRAPVQALVLAEFALPVLAGIGLQALLDTPSQRPPRWLLIGVGVMIALAILATVFQGPLFDLMRQIYPTVYAPDVQTVLDAERFEMLLRSLWMAAFVLGSGALLVWGFLGRRVGATVFVALLALLTVVDLWQIDGTLNHPQPRTAVDAALDAGEVAQFFQADPDLFRILPVGSLFADNRWPAHDVFTAGGYRPAKLRVYQEFMNAFGLPDQVNARALALLNVKYVLSPQPLGTPGLEPVGWTALVYGGQPTQVAIYRFAKALPRAWLVEEYRLAADDGAALDVLRSSDFDPAHTAVLFERPAVEPSSGADGGVEIVDYQLHAIGLQVQADTPRLLVLSEIYYPDGWQAYVDGERVPILRADYVLRAVALDAGEHRVEFRFEPWDVRVGLIVSGIAALLIAAAYALPPLVRRRRVNG